ncbi:MAG: LPXTG cell wall anchor domain-containing protein [Phycisphaera sp. RhM]|nr:LPXTG cell wall anchor domain-containing protein [Phycisphaera sp. RhM]
MNSRIVWLVAGLMLAMVIALLLRKRKADERV